MGNRFHILLTLFALLLLMAACVPVTPEETAAEPEQPKLRVVTSGTILANHIYNIAGDLITIDQIVPPRADPHTYEPTPSDAVKLAEAELVIVRGAANPEAVRR